MDRRPDNTRRSGTSGSSRGTRSGSRTNSRRRRKQRNRRLAILWLCILGVILALALIFFLSSDSNEKKATPDSGTVTGEPTKPLTPGGNGNGTPDPDNPTPTEEAGIDWKTMPLAALEFTEAMSSNSLYAELDGTHPDWIELHNRSTGTITLSDYWISDNKDNPQKYRLPEVTLGPDERYILYCNGKGEGNQAPFKLSSTGEKVYLSNAEGFCDRIKIPEDLPKNASFGRTGSEWLYYDVPSPGNPNNAGYASRTTVPEASIASGVYPDPISVTLFGEGTIYYTLDGSRPTTASKVYSGAIPISGVTTLNAVSVKDGRASDLGSYTYVIGKSHTLPILVLSGPYETTVGPNGVDQLNKKGQGIEAEVTMTLIEDGEAKFAVPCGITLHGNNNGSRDAAKKNFNVHFRAAYGVSKLRYKVFDDLEIDTFNSLLLKGGSEDWARSMIRDEFMTHMVINNTALLAQQCKPVVMYLGGEYWGIYFIRERFSADYIASHFDVPEDSVDLISGVGRLEEGSTKDFNALVKFVKNNDLSKDENFEYFESRVDINSLMDWYICRSYHGDKDLANVRYFRSSEGDNKWRWMYYDIDWGFDPDSRTQANPVSGIITTGEQHVLIYKLVHTQRGRDLFLKRYAYLMNTILNEDYITKELDRWREILTPEAAADRERWGRSLDSWNKAVDYLYTYVKDGKRDKVVLADIKKYFGLSDAEMKAYFGDKYNP